MRTATRRRCLPLIAAALLVAGCHDTPGDPVAASSLSEQGFARDPVALRAKEGQVVRLSGFVDHGNLYGDEDARKILGDWWSGDGPDAGAWRFNLKAAATDRTGDSFAVHVRNDDGRDGLLRRFAQDAAAGRPTPVIVSGRLHTFKAPGNLSSRTGLYLEVASSGDVQAP
jgi:hypothetical protein